MSDEDLRKSNITGNGVLKMKEDYEERVAATVKLGKNEHWSSDGLYRHLCVLQKLVPKAVSHHFILTTGAYLYVEFIRMKHPRGFGSIPSSSAHLQWCHRASSWCSVSSTTSHLQLSNLIVPPPLEVTSTSLPLLVVQAYWPEVNFLNDPFFSSFSAADLLSILRHQGFPQKLDHTLFVSEAKARTLNLEGNVPQAVSEMYACAKQRGSVGCLWCFPILNDIAAAEETLFVGL